MWQGLGACRAHGGCRRRSSAWLARSKRWPAGSTVLWQAAPVQVVLVQAVAPSRRNSPAPTLPIATLTPHLPCHCVDPSLLLLDPGQRWAPSSWRCPTTASSWRAATPSRSCPRSGSRPTPRCEEWCFVLVASRFLCLVSISCALFPVWRVLGIEEEDKLRDVAVGCLSAADG